MDAETVELPDFTVTILSKDEPVPEQPSKQWLLVSENLKGHMFCYHWKRLRSEAAWTSWSSYL